MPKAIDHFRLVVRTGDDAQDVYSTTFPPRIFATEHIYRLARQGDARSRFVFAHEVGHLLLHSQFHPFFRFRQPDRSRAIRSMESQASKFAVAFLIPTSVARQFNDPKLLSVRCKVETEVAELRMVYFNSGKTKGRDDVDRRFQELRSRAPYDHRHEGD